MPTESTQILIEALKGLPGANPQTPVAVTKTLVAAAPQTLVAASGAIQGARILNYTTSPVYLAPGASGTPANGAPSDFVPAAAAGVPGQWTSPYRPITGLRGVGASAGDLAVITW